MRFRLAVYWSLCGIVLASVLLCQNVLAAPALPLAHVVLSDSSQGKHINFLWSTPEKMPFTIGVQDNKVLLHFTTPVAIDWFPVLKQCKPYLQQVEIRDHKTTFVLTFSHIEDVRYAAPGTVANANGIEVILHPSFAQTPASLPMVTGASYNAMSPARLAALSTAAGNNDTLAALPAKETLKIPLAPTEPLAVFTLQNKLWLVFKDKAALPNDFLQHTDLHLVKNGHKLSTNNARIYILDTYEGISASVAPSASGQNIDIILQKSIPAKLSEMILPSISSDAAQHFTFSVPVGKNAQLISVHNDESGDNLQVALTTRIGEGVWGEHAFNAFTLLPTSQGVVFLQKSKDISFSLANEKIDVTSDQAPVISSGQIPEIESMEKQAQIISGVTTLFPYNAWKLADEKDFVPFQVNLMHEIAFNDSAYANHERLRLLELYLAEGLFTEAAGMADDILRSSYRYYREHNVAALRGAAHFFMSRYSEAERDFSAPELAGNAEIAMWLSLCKELLGEGKGETTFDFLNNYPTYIHAYPPVFIQKLAMIGADRAIVRKDYDSALNIFEQLKKDNLDEPVKKSIDFMRGVALSDTKEELEAARIWEQQAGDIDDRFIRARAEFALVNLLLREYKISNEEAEKRLEKLRIVWRGDALELNILTLLSNLYIEDKEYDKALYTLRDIVQYYPDMPDTIFTARKMAEIFQTLYNKNAADIMPPLKALSLFYEFRDLVPLGRDGDMMIRNLADRLVRMDMLDRAELLLEHQIHKRLTGMERSRVGARLALIYLFDHKPNEALEALKTTGYGDLPADLQLTRTRLTAQALAEQDQAAKAIEVLSTDTSPEGNLLRLSIYWGNKDWVNVVSSAEEILSNRNDSSVPLTPKETEVLLKLATAYVYEHDSGQIQYLRDYFTPLLKNKEQRDNFLFITSESGTVDYENLPNLEQDISSVKTFLDNYRDKVKKENLSGAL